MVDTVCAHREVHVTSRQGSWVHCAKQVRQNWPASAACGDRLAARLLKRISLSNDAFYENVTEG